MAKICNAPAMRPQIRLVEIVCVSHKPPHQKTPTPLTRAWVFLYFPLFQLSHNN